MRSVRYGTRLGDLKNKQSTHTPRDRGLGRCVTSATPDSGPGRGITGGGSGYAALLAHAEWVPRLYGMEPGSVTLKINNQHTHT